MTGVRFLYLNCKNLIFLINHYFIGVIYHVCIVLCYIGLIKRSKQELHESG